MIVHAIWRAFFIGLAVFAVTHAMYFVAEFSTHLRAAQDGFIFLSPITGACVIAFLAPRYKFFAGTLLSVPASLLMGVFRGIAIDLGILSSTNYQGVNGMFFVAMMNFPFVIALCAFGAALGCICSYVVSRHKRSSGDGV